MRNGCKQQNNTIEQYSFLLLLCIHVYTILKTGMFVVYLSLCDIDNYNAKKKVK